MESDLWNGSAPYSVIEVDGAPREGSQRAAFFDVDETLITARSPLEFLRYWLASQGDDGTQYEKCTSELLGMVARGLSRESGNRIFYRNYAGAPVAEVMAAGGEWYAAHRNGPEPYVLASVEALARHKAAGDRIVFVSGSFPPCLLPIAEDLGADLVLCTQAMVAEDGTFTGEIGTSVIGEAKADAVRHVVAQLGIAAEDCFAYGDHSSDLDMLQSVGRPVVVGDDPVLVEQAGTYGWPILACSGGKRSMAG